MLEYLISLIVLGGTLLSLAGETWDNKKKGIRKLTGRGKVAAVLTIGLFGLNLYSLKDKQQQSDTMKRVAYAQIQQGINNMSQPLRLNGEADPYARMKDIGYVERLFNRSIFNPLATKGGSNFHEHHYYQDSLNIIKGQQVIESAISTFHDYIDAETISSFEGIKNDKFYHDRYTFGEMNALVQAGRALRNQSITSTAYSTYALYYGTGSGEQRYSGIMSLAHKLEMLKDHVERQL